jgi:hypothetical protein
MKITLSFVLLVCFCSGCTSYKSISKKNEVVSEAKIKSSLKPGGKYKLTLLSGQLLKVKILEVDSIGVHGVRLVRLGEQHPFNDTFNDLQSNTTKISAREFDPLKTLGLLILIASSAWVFQFRNGL